MRWSEVGSLPAELRQHWAAGRLFAARQAPYLATALLALEPLVVEGDDAAGDLSAFPTDQAWHVYLDPAVLERTEVAEVGFWLVHQVSHLLRRHAERCPGADAGGSGHAGGSGAAGGAANRRWNLAADAEINDDLSAGDLAVPTDALRPKHLGCPDGWLAEQYYDALDAFDGNDLGTGGPAGDGRAGAAAAAPASRGDERQGSGRGEHGRDCGSGCDGAGREWDCGRAGLGAVAQKLVRRETAERIREHSRQRGTTPAGWRRWAEEELEPADSWQRLLAAAVRRGVAEVAGRVDFTYRRPSRRASALPGVVLPSLRQYLPEVAVVLDTSGSMSDTMLGQALAEVGGVLKGLGVGRRRLRVLCCDASAYEAQRVLDAAEVRLLGGGGTDMGAGLAAATALRPRPDLVIVLTDGHTPWPAAAPPGVRVVCGLLDAAGTVPDWARSVLVDLAGTPGASGASGSSGASGTPPRWR